MPLSLKRFWWCLIGIFFPDNTRKRRRFFVFREDSPKMCRRKVVVASKRLSLSLSSARARRRPTKEGFKKRAKKYAKNVFLYLKNISLSYGVQQRHNAPLADVRAPTRPTGRGGLTRDGFESVVVFVRASRLGSADDGETRDRRRDVVQTRTPGRRKARKEKSETRAARDGVAIARHG